MATPQTEDIPHVADDGSVSYVGQAIGWRTPGPGWPQRPGVITHGGISGSRHLGGPRSGLVFALLTNRWEAPDEPTMAILDAVYEATGAPDAAAWTPARWRRQATSARASRGGLDQSSSMSRSACAAEMNQAS